MILLILQSIDVVIGETIRELIVLFIHTNNVRDPQVLEFVCPPDSTMIR